MKKSFLVVCIFAALALGVLAILSTWSAVTPVNPPTTPDTTATPNPNPQAR